jgi:hypothetical protein
VFASQGGYSEGAIGYVSGDPGGFGDLDGPNADDLNESWAVRAGLRGPLFNNLTGWINGAWTHVEENDVGTSGDEYDWWAIVAGAAWEPVPGLTMGPEGAFQSFDLTDPNGDERNGWGDYDVWGVMWRVQRSF